MDDVNDAEAAASANDFPRPDAATAHWSDETIDTLCKMLAQGETGTAIAEVIGVGRGAVRGKIASMERKGDARLPSQRPRRGGVKVKRTTIEQMDALADLMASGVKTIAGAARLLSMQQQRADQVWQRIRRELGAQAQ